MTFISYAQNHEDVILWRALKQVKNGFYIDVGANHPEFDSVTKSFYDRGWSGVNVEPIGQWFDLLCLERERDINLKITAGAKNDQIILYEFQDTGLSTIDKVSAQRIVSENNFQYIKRSIPVRTLTDICNEQKIEIIHFLKIDVEGAEKDVLRGIDFTKVRPWILLVESTQPNIQIQDHDKWEWIILEANYEYVYFDGINRYYVAEEHNNFKKFLNAPPNRFDSFKTSETLQVENEHQKAIKKLQNSLKKIEQMETFSFKTGVEFYKKEDQLQSELDKQQVELEKILKSYSWKLTKPLRSINKNIKNILQSRIKLLSRILNKQFTKKIIRRVFITVQSHTFIRNQCLSLAKKLGLQSVIDKTYLYCYEQKNDEKQIVSPIKNSTELKYLSPRACKIYSDLKKSIEK